MDSLEMHCSHLNCEWTGLLKNFDEHFEEHFKTTAVGRTRPVGCFTRLDEGCNVEDHFQGTLFPHMELVADRLSTLETQLRAVSGSHTDGILGNVEQRLTNPELELKSAASTPTQSETNTALTPALEKFAVLDGVLVVLNRTVEKLTADVQSLESQRRLDREMMEKTRKKMKALERLLFVKEDVLYGLLNRVANLEQANYDGVSVLRVTDVASKWINVMCGGESVLYSSPFYTSHTGYKMSFCVYLNGNGIGKGSHLSVFFFVMRGNCDALLHWPFRQLVTFTLLNQTGYDDIVYAFRPKPSDSISQRPTTEMNRSGGCATFAPLEVLDERAEKGFVKDDQLFLKVTVDISDISVNELTRVDDDEDED